MTTISFDGRFLAADGRAQRGGSIVTDSDIKLSVGQQGPEGIALGAAGISNWRDAWWEWARGGADPARLPPHSYTGGENFALIRVRKIGGQCWVGCCDHAIPYFGEDADVIAAWGMGREFALGAMEFGASAMQAVEVAARRDPHTGGMISYIDMAEDVLTVQAWRGIGTPPHPKNRRRMTGFVAITSV